jgi:hypothetical protein
MPAGRRYDVRLPADTIPAQVWRNGQPLEHGEGMLNWRYDRQARTVRLTVVEDPARRLPQVVRVQHAE